MYYMPEYMDADDEPEKIGQNPKNDHRRVKYPNLDAITLLQVDATSIVGVLFFLTLTSYLSVVPEEFARPLTGSLTVTIVIPFAVSAMAITYPKGFYGTKTWNQGIFGKEWKQHDPTLISFKRLKIANVATFLGFVYLVFALISIVAYSAGSFPNIALFSNVTSTMEDCARDPELYGVNVTPWKCSMFTTGSLAERCAMNSTQYKMSKTECSRFIPP